MKLIATVPDPLILIVERRPRRFSIQVHRRCHPSDRLRLEVQEEGTITEQSLAVDV